MTDYPNVKKKTKKECKQEKEREEGEGGGERKRQRKRTRYDTESRYTIILHSATLNKQSTLGESAAPRCVERTNGIYFAYFRRFFSRGRRNPRNSGSRIPKDTRLRARSANVETSQSAKNHAIGGEDARVPQKRKYLNAVLRAVKQKGIKSRKQRK